ncbi:MAG: cadmium-translocating P-type ATPase [Holophagales bacterium]|nr:cadmium-translocating P-type ATPase [Holophagales bacterium]
MNLPSLPSLPTAGGAPPAAAPPADGPEVELLIKGMHCASCVGRIEKALGKVPGVSLAVVDLLSGRARVRLSDPALAAERLVAAVSEAGYEAREAEKADLFGLEELVDAEQAERAAVLKELSRKLAVALAVAVPVAVLSMAEVTFPGRDGLFLVLTAVVLGFSGRDILVTGARALARLAPEMNSLVALGTSSAFLTSAAATFFPHLFHVPGGHAPVYFEAAVVIVALVLLGRFLEERAKGKAGEAIRALARLGARSARLVRPDGDVEVPLERVRAGDLLRILPGEKVPTDGVLVEGATAVDEALVTGESIPVEKVPGDPLLGATVNGNGAIVMKATRVGKETALAQVVKLVRQAQATKAPVQRLVDRVAAVFVPVVVVVALLSFAGWFFLGPEPKLLRALLAATSVLLVACPCALGLATPTALVVGTGRGAELGLLLRDAGVLEKAARVTTVVFDKTGTLTAGRPAVTALRPADGVTEESLLSSLASLETGSEHPLAKAVLEAARARGIRVERGRDVAAVPGGGVTGTVNGAPALAGSEGFLAARGVTVPPELLDAGGDGTLVLLAVSGKVLGAVVFSDPVKPHAREVLAALAARGLSLHLLSGDRPGAVVAAAREAGIPAENVAAGLSPADKAERVTALRAKGGFVAMVGDGINDAPALSAADLGIAIGSGTDVARAASDVTLVGGALSGVGMALDLSKATLRNVRQNLFLAFVYNVVLIPVAAGVLYPVTGWTLNPMLASLAMAASSVSVVTNALRLRRFGT